MASAKTATKKESSSSTNMNTPTLIKHESPGGPYWYHPDHPLCQDGKVLWEDHVECTGCEGRGEVGGQFPDGSYQTDPCPHCDGEGFVAVELPSGSETETHNNSDH